MIIFGSKNKEITKERLSDQCPNCGTQNSVNIYVYQKYAHVFWIPFFPMGKTGVSQCEHCKQALDLKEMSPSFRLSYDNLKSQTKAPIWMFSGLTLGAILITIGVISDRNNDEKNEQLVLTPKSGDIFEIRTKDDQYTLYKIEQVESDSVFVQVSNFETNKISGLADLKKKDYSDELWGYTKEELKQMLHNGEIIDIERK